jgi:hypothetical protein
MHDDPALLEGERTARIGVYSHWVPGPYWVQGLAELIFPDWF